MAAIKFSFDVINTVDLEKGLIDHYPPPKENNIQVIIEHNEYSITKIKEEGTRILYKLIDWLKPNFN